MDAPLIRLAVAMTLLAACASPEIPQRSGTQAAPYPPTAFAHRAANSELVMYWNCIRPDPGLLRVEGVAQSPWHAQPIRSLEFEVVGVDSQERLLSQARGAARDSAISTNQTSPFVVDLRTTGGEVRFDLYYQYQFHEGEQVGAWLTGPPVAGLRLFAQRNRSLVRDVCSETQHRAR
jgi:hypothetical protein